MDAKDRIIQEQRELIEELRREVEELKLALAKATIDLCVANDRWGARGGLSAPESVRLVAGADKPPLAPVH